MSTRKLKKTGFRITFDDGETAIKYLQPINSKLGKFLVHFRRSTDYENNGTTKEYGFDWLRDEYIYPMNNVTLDSNGNILSPPLNQVPLCLNVENLKNEYSNEVLNSISPHKEEYYPSWLSLKEGNECFLDIEIEVLETLITPTNTKITFEIDENSGLEIDKTSIELD